MIPASPIPVALIVIRLVLLGTVVSALAAPKWLAHHPTAGRSVSSTQTVPLTRPAPTRSVRTPVQACVASTPTVGSTTMFPSASALLALLVIHSHSAISQAVSWRVSLSCCWWLDWLLSLSLSLSHSLKTWIRIKKINFFNGHGTGTSYNT